MVDSAAVEKARAILRLLAALALLSLAGAPVACATGQQWESTRKEVIDPIHRLLHHTYPEAFQTGDPARIAETFSPEALPDQLAPSLELLATFSEVEYGTGFIDKVDLDAQPVRGWIRLKLEGSGLDGERRVVRQRKEFELVHEDGAWRIARDAPTPFVAVPQPEAHFFDETLTRALWFQHEGKDKIDPKGTPRRYVYGSGIAASDLDGDGWDDLVLASGGRVDVFVNEEGTFRQASEEWGVGDALPAGDRIFSAVVAADFDDDGFQDLFVAAEFGQPYLLRGDGRRFAVVSDSGLHTAERTISASVADFDGDGSLDLYLANHEDEYRRAPDPPWSENAEPDQLFLNRGDGTFRDATRQAGLGNAGWALAPVAADYDGDGDVDLFVGNDFGTSVLYRNDGRGDFEEVASDAGVDAPVAAMGADWGDYDGDGDLDLFVGGMSSNAAWVLEAPQFQIRKVPAFVDWMFRDRVREYVRAWFRGNRFYENRGDGTFVERAHELGVDAHGWSWATVWLDFDNDGHLDVYALNGFITGPLEDDF